MSPSPRTWPGRGLRLALGIAFRWALTMAPPVFLAVEVARYAIDVPFWDEWELVPLVDASARGALSLADLAAQHNEHRPLLPRAAMLLLAGLSSWDTRLELAVTLALAVLLLLVWTRLIAAARAACGKGDGAGWLLPAASIATFSLAQWENWTWGWQMSILMSVAAVAAGMGVLARPRLTPGSFTLGILLGLVATYSFANGLLYWPLGFLVLALAVRPARQRLLGLAAWSAASLAVHAAYFHGYVKPAHHPALSVPFSRPLEYLAYVGLYLGTPLMTFRRPGALALGYAGLLLFAALAVRLGRRRPDLVVPLAPLLALCLYAIASALVTGVARVGLGAEQGMSSRYVTFALPFWVSLVVLLGCLEERRGTVRGAARSLSVAIVLLLALSSIKSKSAFRKHHDRLAPARDALLAGRDGDPVLQVLYPASLHERAEVLRRLRLSLFRESGVPGRSVTG